MYRKVAVVVGRGGGREGVGGLQLFKQVRREWTLSS